MCTGRFLWNRGEGGTEEFLMKLCNFTLAPFIGICLVQHATEPPRDGNINLTRSGEGPIARPKNQNKRITS